MAEPDASAWAWSAAGRAPSSAACTAWRRGSTTATSWSPARFRPRPDKASARRQLSASRPIAPTPTFADMAQAEAARADGIDAVAIVTPNHMHAPVAEAFLDAGIHVICDKPLTTTLAEARRLRDKARDERLIFARDPQLHRLSAGAPGARDGAGGRTRRAPRGAGRISAGLAGRPLEATGQKQADWRTDPARSGAGGCVGDIGTHAFHLADSSPG